MFPEYLEKSAWQPSWSETNMQKRRANVIHQMRNSMRPTEHSCSHRIASRVHLLVDVSSHLLLGASSENDAWPPLWNLDLRGV